EGGLRRRTVVDRGDEPVPAARQRLNKAWGLRPVPERAADLEDAAFQHPRLDVRLGPYGREELVLRHELASMRHEQAQDRKRLGCQQQALVGGGLPAAPETLVNRIELEWRELLHACPSTVGMAGAPADGQEEGMPASLMASATPAASAARHSTSALEQAACE